jgi:hypothetical protein
VELIVEGISHRYGETVALEKIDLEVREGSRSP